MFGRAFALLPLCAALILAACQSAPPPPPKPTFYEDLASPTAHLDEQKALSMLNQYRAQSGIAPLALDPRLNRRHRRYTQNAMRPRTRTNTAQAVPQSATEVSSAET